MLVYSSYIDLPMAAPEQWGDDRADATFHNIDLRSLLSSGVDTKPDGYNPFEIFDIDDLRLSVIKALNVARAAGVGPNVIVPRSINSLSDGERKLLAGMLYIKKLFPGSESNSMRESDMHFELFDQLSILAGLGDERINEYQLMLCISRSYGALQLPGMSASYQDDPGYIPSKFSMLASPDRHLILMGAIVAYIELEVLHHRRKLKPELVNLFYMINSEVSSVVLIKETLLQLLKQRWSAHIEG